MHSPNIDQAFRRLNHMNDVHKVSGKLVKRFSGIWTKYMCMKIHYCTKFLNRSNCGNTCLFFNLTKSCKSLDEKEKMC